jgi:hypothetical protein
VSKREGYLCFFLSRLSKFSCTYEALYEGVHSLQHTCAGMLSQLFQLPRVLHLDEIQQLVPRSSLVYQLGDLHGERSAVCLGIVELR